ncbi:MAG: chaperone modulator CbpM [Casimicrobiaceae bacterium]
MRVELTEVLWFDERHELSLHELAERSGLSEAELRELVDSGVIAPVDPDRAPRHFRAECIVTAKTACRLRDDFELDAHGLAVALTLIDRVRDLEGQLRDLRAKLPRQVR